MDSPEKFNEKLFRRLNYEFMYNSLSFWLSLCVDVDKFNNIGLDR